MSTRNDQHDRHDPTPDTANGTDTYGACSIGAELTGPTPAGADLTGAAWRKSSHSNGATNCVEVARLADGSVGVRHSRRPDGAVIVYSRSEWAAFLAGVKAEEFEVETA
ncbi:DUF397 domain-containing protein [Catenulispora subtropica]|uniref:DUF397 domain-containing protein n=1 Tax=Catenulispora subtropica TaxID=450798 RepID=A0ABP5EHB3_9ACTN